MKNVNFKTIAIEAVGGTELLPLWDKCEEYHLTGSERLSSNFTLSFETPTENIPLKKGMGVTIRNNALATDLDGNTVTVMGQDIDNVLMAISWKMECVYDGTQWIVQIFESVAVEDSSF